MKNNLLNNRWKIISSIAIFSVLFFIIIGFIFPGEAVDNGFFDKDDELLGKRELWVQYVMNFIYFTFISNAMVMVISIFRVKNKQSSTINILMLIGAASITMTMIVYWAILFWGSKLNAYEMINTVLVHLVVPVAFLIGFGMDIKTKAFSIELPVGKTLLITLAFPVIWLFMSLIFYYSLGGNIEHAIYGFLHHNGQSVMTSLMYVIGIAVGFSAFSFGFIKLYSLSTK